MRGFEIDTICASTENLGQIQISVNLDPEVEVKGHIFWISWECNNWTWKSSMIKFIPRVHPLRGWGVALAATTIFIFIYIASVHNNCCLVALCIVTDVNNPQSATFSHSGSNELPFNRKRPPVEADSDFYGEKVVQSIHKNTTRKCLSALEIV